MGCGAFASEEEPSAVAPSMRMPSRGRIGLRTRARVAECSLAVLAIAISASVLSSGFLPVISGIAGPRDEVASSALDFEWRTGPQLLIARAAAAAVTLPSGDVLVIGGTTPNGPTASTEVFDARLSLWKLGPQMSVKRVGHTATLLNDGTVLVAGGDTGSGTTSTAEIIDLRSGASIPVPSMSFARAGHAAVLLDDGRVLVTGGTNWVTGVWNQAEVFDPVAVRWLPAGTMSSPRLFFSMLLLNDGNALAIGGDIAGTSEVFNPSTNTWSMRSNLTSARNNAAAAKIGGRIVVAGGKVAGYPTNTTEVYDAARNTWSAAGNMTEPRARFTLTPLPGGGLLAAGSYANSASKTACEIFDPGPGTWSRAPPMNVSRGEHAAAVLSSGAVLMIGGRSMNTITSSVEVFFERPVVPKRPCMPIDLVPLVRAATELPGNSGHGLIAKLRAAQTQYDADDFSVCLNIMNAFYNQVRAFALNGHMTRAHADALYDGYASVVECVGGTPNPPLPASRSTGASLIASIITLACPVVTVFPVYSASDKGV